MFQKPARSSASASGSTCRGGRLPQPGDDRRSCACRASTTTPRASRSRCSGRRKSTREILTGEAWQGSPAGASTRRKLFSAYLHTLRWNCVTVDRPEPLPVPVPGRHPDRRLPARAAPARPCACPGSTCSSPTTSGLGKTIEAGLIARELLLRKKVQDIVVACPPSMLLQWQDELEDRFGLVFEILDKDYVARVRRERGFGVNPWTTHTRFLVSHRLLIDEAYAGPLRDWLGDFRPGSLLILDEAHHAAPSSGAKYAIDSKITRAVRDLAGRFEHRLFLSATPHNGHSNSFSALLEILDPQRFCRGVPVRGKKVLDDVMVRRLKEDLREVAGRLPEARSSADRHRRPAGRRPRTAALASCSTSTASCARSGSSGETKRKQAAAALLDLRAAAAAALLGRGVRPHAPRPPPHGAAALGSGRGRTSPSRATSRRAARSSPRASTTTTTGPRSPRRNSRPRKTPRSRRPRGDTTPAGTATRFARERAAPRRDDRDRRGSRAACPTPGSASSSTGFARTCARTCRRSGRCRPRGRPPGGTTRRSSSSPSTTTRSATSSSSSTAAIEGTDRADERIAIFHGPTPPGRARGDQAGLQRPTRRSTRVRILIATDAAREGLNLQTHCCEPVPLRRALEPEPHGAAQRPHRPQAPAQRRGLLPLLRLHRSARRTASSRSWSGRPRRSRRSWAASPR